MSASIPVSFHQPLTMWGSTRLPESISRVDRVGDLQLAAARGLDRVGGVEDLGREHVDADEGKVAGRVLGLLDQADDAVAVELGDAVGARVLDLVSRINASGLDDSKLLDQLDDAVAQQVVAEVHHEGARRR